MVDIFVNVVVVIAIKGVRTMTRMVRYDPFQNLRKSFFSISPFGEEFDDYLGEVDLGLRVNVSDDETKVTVEADLPGINPDDVDLDVLTDSVTIHAKREETEEEKNRNYIRRERRYGSYARTINLPSQVVPTSAEATFTDGTLMLTIDKVVTQAPTKVKVKVNRSEK